MSTSSPRPVGNASEPAHPAASPAIRLAAALAGLEALVLVGLAVALLFSVSRDRLTEGITTTVFFLLYAVGLGLAARGLLRLRSWSRGPVVLAQFIELGVAWNFYGHDTVWVAVLAGIPPVVVLVIIFRRATTEALYGVRVTDDDPSSRR